MRLREIHIWWTSAHSGVERPKKGTMDPANTSVWEGSASPAFVLMSDIQFLLLCAWWLLRSWPSTGTQSSEY